jgi:acetoacetate decarboxylase
MNAEEKNASPLSLLRKLMEPMRRGTNLWDNARFVLADVPLKKQEVKRILPLGLWPSDPPMGTFFIANYTKTSFTAPYHEAALLLHVRTILGAGVHCCWMPVNDDTAMIYGRELLGYPKKMARIEYEEGNGVVRGSVTRRGIKVLAMEGVRGPVQVPAPPVFNYKTFNAGGPGQLFGLNPVWLFRPREVIHESYSAEVSVTLNDSEYDPVARLVAGPPVRGRIAVTDIPGSKYNLPVGVAGPLWFMSTFFMRYR